MDGRDVSDIPPQGEVVFQKDSLTGLSKAAQTSNPMSDIETDIPGTVTERTSVTESTKLAEPEIFTKTCATENTKSTDATSFKETSSSRKNSDFTATTIATQSSSSTENANTTKITSYIKTSSVTETTSATDSTSSTEAASDTQTALKPGECSFEPLLIKEEEKSILANLIGLTTPFTFQCERNIDKQVKNMQGLNYKILETAAAINIRDGEDVCDILDRATNGGSQAQDISFLTKVILEEVVEAMEQGLSSERNNFGPELLSLLRLDPSTPNPVVDDSEGHATSSTTEPTVDKNSS